MAAADRVRIGPFRIDVSRQLLTREDSAIHLRPKAWELLCYLVERAGRLVSHEELLNRLWRDTAIQPQALTRLIFELRQVLEADSAIRIENVARRGYRLIARVEAELDPAEATPTTRPGPPTAPARMIGRDADLARLDGCWQHALDGRRQLVFVGGEPGVGKTTLVHAFLDQLEGISVALGQCPRRHGEAEPYMPLLEALERLAARSDLAATLRRFAPAWLVQMPWLAAPEEADGLRRSLSGIGEARMLREGIRMLEALSSEQPLVLVLEDLHWSDAATIDLLRALGERTSPARLLMIGTYRTTEIALSPHPLRETVSHLVHRADAATRLVLDNLGHAAIDAYLLQRFGNPELVRAVTPIVERKSGGNPLFLSSLTDCLVSDGAIVRADPTWELRVAPETLEATLPDGLREIIGEQLARLPADRCELLEAASAAGDEFTAYELAAALAQREDEVESICIDLAQRSPFVRSVGERPWPGGGTVQTFALAHALYAQVLAKRIAPLRRRALHARIGECLEAAYGTQSIEIAGRLASLFEAAGNAEKQALYFELAALRAHQRFAHREAVACLAEAIAAIRRLPETPARTQREAERWLDLANLSIVTSGFNDRRARQAFDRAWELTRDGVEPLIAFRAQLGRCITELMAFANAGESRDQLGQLASSVLELANDGHPEWLAAAHMYNACVSNALGEFRAAIEHCSEGRRYLSAAMPGIPRDADLEVTISIFEAQTLASLGAIADSRKVAASVLRRLKELSVPQQQVSAQTLLAEAALTRRDDDQAHDLATAAIAIGRESGVGNYLQLAHAIQGCARLSADPVALEAVESALQARRAVGERWWETLILLRLSAFHRAGGELERAQQCMADAAGLNETRLRCEVWREGAEILERSRTAGAVAKAEADLRASIALARDQEAILFESRAAVALGRLLLAANRGDEALALVSDIHRRFPPVDDAADLHDLESLLDQLRANESRA